LAFPIVNHLLQRRIGQQFCLLPPRLSQWTATTVIGPDSLTKVTKQRERLVLCQAPAALTTEFD